MNWYTPVRVYQSPLTLVIRHCYLMMSESEQSDELADGRYQTSLRFSQGLDLQSEARECSHLVRCWSLALGEADPKSNLRLPQGLPCALPRVIQHGCVVSCTQPMLREQCCVLPRLLYGKRVHGLNLCGWRTVGVRSNVIASEWRCQYGKCSWANTSSC